MFCLKCGTTIPQGAAFCPTCGAAISPDPYSTKTEEPVIISDVSDTTQDTSTEGYTQYPTYQGEGAPTPTPVYSPTSNYTPAVKDNSWAAITAFVCGIVSCVCCGSCVTGIPAVIFGIIGLKTEKRVFAIVGLVLGVLAIILTIVVAVISANNPEFIDAFMEGYYSV